MTPAIDAARKAGIHFKVHEYRHDPNAPSYGEEAADALGLEHEQVFKTLIAVAEGNPAQLIVAVVPVPRRLDLKALASRVGAKRMKMAEGVDAERATGYIVGGISPLGQRKRLPLVLDASALRYEVIYVSAGRRGLEIELAPGDLVRLTGARTAAIAR